MVRRAEVATVRSAQPTRSCSSWTSWAPPPRPQSNLMTPRRVIVLGSTGSIGVQALEVIRDNPDRFELVGLAAGSNRTLLEQQGAAFGVSALALGAVEAAQLASTVDAEVVL